MSPHAVTPDEAGLRADVLCARLSGASRSLVAAAARDGLVRVNGDAVRPSRLLLQGDVLSFEIPHPQQLVAVAQPIALDVVYEDDDLIVVDKPAGMVTHPARGATGGTLLNALLAHAGSLPGEPLRAGLVHRLDRDTSGLLVVAKNDASLAALGRAMMRRRISRVYLAIVAGVPEHPRGRIEGPIGRDPRNRLRYAIVADGKRAITNYEMQQAWERYSELAFTLETGRTHQIRVHAAASGHPILNDPIYGHEEPRFGLRGQALHAWRLEFEHPRTREPLAFVAQPPQAYLRAREMLSHPS
ncbi:MAG: RluA family pseudouridine synthase [Candidatus Tyrphobacter sp.]